MPNCALLQFTVTILHSLPLKTDDVHLTIMHSSTCWPNAMKMCELQTLKSVAKWNKQIVRNDEYLPALLSLFLPHIQLFMAHLTCMQRWPASNGQTDVDARRHNNFNGLDSTTSATIWADL